MAKVNPKTKVTPAEKQCVKCQNPKKSTEFYASHSVLNSDGRVPICKHCLKRNLSIDDIKSVQDILRQIDRPFLQDLWEISKGEGKDAFGKYMKNLGMRHNKHLTWADSVFGNNDKNLNSNSVPNDNSDLNKKSDFVVTDELIDKWGYGYNDDDYMLFERKYALLRRSYDEKTAMHSEGLKTYIRYRVKEEQATAIPDVKAAKEWGAMAAKAATDAKLNVSQMNKSDISGGIDVISQLFEAVESEVGIIPLLPRLLEQPYDDADLIIWATINYNRRLEDKPSVAYRDVWNFYDEMLGEYFEQQGFNEMQIKEFKEKRNNVFRDLSEVYKEPIYESDGET